MSREKTLSIKRRESEALTTCHCSEDVSLRLSLSSLDTPASFIDLIREHTRVSQFSVMTSV